MASENQRRAGDIARQGRAISERKREANAIAQALNKEMDALAARAKESAGRLEALSGPVRGSEAQRQARRRVSAERSREGREKTGQSSWDEVWSRWFGREAS